MKNTYRLGFILCLSLLFSLSGWSQFQQFNLGIQGPNGEPVPIAGIPGDGPRPRPEQPFDFDLRFDGLFELVRLENAILNRQRAVVDEWFGRQQGTFLREINRQLGTSHTNFRNAQRDYFKNFEEHFRGLNSEVSRLARGRFDLADQQENEQLTYSGELYFIDDFKGNLRAHLDCNFDFGGICDFIGHRTEVVQGTRLADVRNFSVLNNLENLALEDFARTEYEPALNRRCAIGLNKIRNNGFLANRFANAHLSYYDDRDLRNKVFLMTAYLNITGSNIRPPFALPIQRVQIPGSFWDSSTLLELGKDNGPFEGEEAKVFLEGYIAWRVNRAINLPSQESPEAVFNRLNAIRDRVIAEHKQAYGDNLQRWYLDNDGDGYHARTLESSTSPGEKWSTGTAGVDCDDTDPRKWRILNKSNFFENSPLNLIGTGGPITPSTPSTTDDFVFGGGNSGLPKIQPKNLEAFTKAQSGEASLGGLNPFSDDSFWVTENLLEKTENELFDYFEDALDVLTTGSQANAALNDLLNHFKGNSGDSFMNDKLSNIIKFGDGNGSADRTVGDFMNSLFNEICDKLSELNDQCVGDLNIDITSLRYPNFPLSDPNLIAQLGGIQGAGVFIDASGNLTAELYDTFGVSEEDAVKRDGLFGNTITGGSIGTKAMRILQTHFGKKPFVHGVKIDPASLGESGFNLNDCN